jgi:hypothetical protein
MTYAHIKTREKLANLDFTTFPKKTFAIKPNK